MAAVNAIVFVPIWIGDGFTDDLDALAAGLREKMVQGGNLELDYAGVTDEEREQLAEMVRILDPVVVRL
jgi:hypothetical protein